MSESGKILGESRPTLRRELAKERIRQTTTYGISRNRIMENKYGPKIASFKGEVDYARSADPEYIAQVANDALKHFGFKGNAKIYANPMKDTTDYFLIIDGNKVVSGYQVPGADRGLNTNLARMVEDAILYKIQKKEGLKQTADLVDASGSIRGMNWKFKR